MKDLHFGKKKETKWFMGKNFYIALSVSLIAIGIAAYVAVNQTMNNLNKKADESSSSSENNANIVNNTQSGVGYPSSNSENKSSSQSSSSSSPDSKPSENKEKTDSSQKNQKENTLFTMPLKGEILNKFSNGELVKSKTLGDWRTHDGIDIKAKQGTPVKSVADGKVLDIKEDGMWGVVVVVEHSGGYKSHYKGLSATVDVKKGQALKIGDTIGTVGETAHIEVAEESHFHLGMTKGDKWIDPLSVLTNP